MKGKIGDASDVASMGKEKSKNYILQPLSPLAMLN